MEGHVMEGVTYEIVDVVDASAYPVLAHPEDDQAADIEYLELDMEVVEAVSDAAEYFSNAEESQDEEKSQILGEPVTNAQQIIQVNGTVCGIKQEVNGVVRKRRTSDGDEDVGWERENKGTREKSECDSLDLFFKSMAQTVLHLPAQAQAKIKMEICKVISRAEIKYCDQRKGRTD